MPRSSWRDVSTVQSSDTREDTQGPECPHQSGNEVEHDAILVDRHNTRTRGKTSLKSLWNMRNQKLLVNFNGNMQPIGREAKILADFCGLVARTARFCPLTYQDWRQIPSTTKEEMKVFIKEKFQLNVEDESYANKFVLESLGRKWKEYRHNLKNKYHDPTKSAVEVARQVPEGRTPAEWESLVSYWYSEKGKKKSKVGLNSRAQQKYTHTSGSKSFARKEREMEIESGQKPGRISFYKATHTRKDGTYINTTFAEQMEKADELLQAQQASTEDSSVNMKELEDRIFVQVTGEERSGRVRGCGAGVTPTTYYGSSSQGSISVSEFERVTEESRENKRQLEEMKARMDWMTTLLQRVMPGVEMPHPSQPSVSDSHSPAPQGFNGLQ